MNDDVQRLFERQACVARRDQLRRTGLTTAQLRAQLAARRWRALGEVIVVGHNGPLDRRQQCWAVVLTAGGRGWLAGLTALESAGLRGWATDDIHLQVPRGTTFCALPEVPLIRHETRRTPHAARQVNGYPPHPTVERAAVDAAAWARDARTAAGVLAAVVQQRLTTAPRLLRELDQAGPIRRRRLLRLLLADIAGGAEALSEIDFARLCRRYQLGRVVHQLIRPDAKGRRRYLDGEIEGPSGRRVRFEVDGAVHLLASSYWDDMKRQNELFIARTPLLRFSTYAFRFEEAVVADQVRRALSR
jgi:hypothetical protein